MPIGPITPGSYVTVAPDASLSAYTSLQAPTATMGVVASDIQALTLVILNVQEFVRGETVSNYLNKFTGGTVSGPLVVTGTADFEGAGVDRPTFLGLVINSGELTLGASSTLSSSGTNVFASGSDTSFDGTGVLKTTNGGKFRWDTRNKSDGDYTADGTNGYEDILPDPAANRAITLANTGAALGQRKKFNAQNVTGSNYWALSYSGRVWYLSNLNGYPSGTVKIEFVYDGSGWLVDSWEHGGSTIRNG